MHRLSTFFADETGASAAEYALILALVAIVIIGGLTILGTTINTRAQHRRSRHGIVVSSTRSAYSSRAVEPGGLLCVRL